MSYPPSSSSGIVTFNLEPESLLDRDPEELEAFRLPLKIDLKKCAIRIRPFQPEDADQVRELFWIGIAVGPLSARAAALRGSLTRPSSIVLYLLFLLGLYVAITSSPPPPPRYAAILNLPITPISDDVVQSFFYQRLLGIALSLVSVAFFVVHRYHLGKIFRDHANPKRSPDLMNIGGHYGLSTAQDENHATAAEKFDPQNFSGRMTVSQRVMLLDALGSTTRSSQTIQRRQNYGAWLYTPPSKGGV
ncbi:hypothetical protein EST38_g2670 [Candolleomyces aberdarensis]|uniref:Uncharacterized protein n=1 Tax=Candolleomyces aberdarensis TaxID=2316362 RepID=A0A4Q2DSZ3_9AGAR|nr:hypothetical protein EST38_g2670 [Candolleomyces aberdarensis]